MSFCNTAVTELNPNKPRDNTAFTEWHLKHTKEQHNSNNWQLILHWLYVNWLVTDMLSALHEPLQHSSCHITQGKQRKETTRQRHWAANTTYIYEHCLYISWCKANTLIGCYAIWTQAWTDPIMKNICMGQWTITRWWMVEHMAEWVSEWASEWVSEWVRAWVGGWVGGWVSAWVDGWVDEWASEQASEWATDWMTRYAWMNESTIEQTEKCTIEQTTACTNR